MGCFRALAFIAVTTSDGWATEGIIGDPLIIVSYKGTGPVAQLLLFFKFYCIIDTTRVIILGRLG